MKTLNKVITLTFFLLLPLVLLSLLSENWGLLSRALSIGFLNQLFGGLLMLWIASGIVFFALLLFSKANREAMLARLANVQERDEREEQIVGRAAKQTFLFMLALLLALFAASTLHYSEDGHGLFDKPHASVSVGHGGFIDDRVNVTTQFDGHTTTEVQMHDVLPLSKTGLLLLLIVTQLLAYRFASGQGRQSGTE